MTNFEELYAHEDEDHDEFRDAIATVDKEGKRIWLYPKKVHGAFYNKRIWATLVFLALFFSGPFIKINGLPLLMMNIFERKFSIFGKLFLPQDFVIFGLGMITFVVFIIVFTVSFGRIWCGWLCPQTVFLEMIFRPIENWLEGNGQAQKKFDLSPWNINKIGRKTLKHLIFIAISILIAHFTMAYIIGIENVKNLITQPPTQNLTGFIGLVVFTGIFYFVFARLREQVCISICPYGRLQGVLVTHETMNIIYDDVRGEPRGRITKNSAIDVLPKGDCVDCKLCVQVCPTGIDIRNGIQLECVNCTACIDACDEVMEKVGKPKGLIRYASLDTINKNIPFRLTKRIIAYIFVLISLIGIEAILLLNRSEVETTIMRVPGQLYQESGTKITNLYNAQLVNKTNAPKTVHLKLEDFKGNLKIVGANQNIVINPGSKAEAVFFVEIEKSILTKRKTPLIIEVMDKDKTVSQEKTNFLGPN